MHNVTKKFIESNGLWRSGNSERSEARTKSKALKDLKCPNEEQIILLKYKEYLASPDLREGLESLQRAALPETPPLSDREFVELGKKVTLCRSFHLCVFFNYNVQGFNGNCCPMLYSCRYLLYLPHSTLRNLTETFIAKMQSTGSCHGGFNPYYFMNVTAGGFEGNHTSFIV